MSKRVALLRDVSANQSQTHLETAVESSNFSAVATARTVRQRLRATILLRFHRCYGRCSADGQRGVVTEVVG
jgi:hypothetical protein